MVVDVKELLIGVLSLPLVPVPLAFVPASLLLASGSDDEQLYS